MFSRLHQIWFAPIDASFLSVFRIMFGGVLLFESVNYGLFLCLDCMYRSSDMLFKYHHFEWVGLWPGFGLELNFLVMGICAICIMLGLYYRLAMLVYTLCFSYVFFLDQALYLNHFYLVILFCCIMVFVPANVYWSVDAHRKPAIASTSVPAWSRLWLVIQLEIVLIYAGIVKLNWDWLNLEPMRLWMNSQSQNAHPFFQWITQDPGIAAASYGVVLLHLVGAPLLLWRKTRLPVFLLYCVFHTINAFVFNIGIFPWMTIAATLVLFDPNWPKQLYTWWCSKRGSLIKETNTSANHTCALPPTLQHGKLANLFLVVFIVGWLTAQVLIPLRHWQVPGDVTWNEGGHRFSWRMKLRSKVGDAKFYVVTNSEPAIIVDPATHLNRAQVFKMACIPDLIWQFAQFLEQEHMVEQNDDIKVYVDTNCSLNTREAVPLINRLIDLTAIPRTEPLRNWVTTNSKLLPKKYLNI